MSGDEEDAPLRGSRSMSARRTSSSVGSNKGAVGGALLLSLALLVYLLSSKLWRIAGRQVVSSELSAIAKEEMEDTLAKAGFIKAAHASHGAPGDLPVIAPSDCIDRERDCRAWAAAGECLNNAAYMVGSEEGGLGACVAACGLCNEAPRAAAAVMSDCNDVFPDCGPLRDAGECSNNPDWMVGTEGFEGQCRLTCGACTRHDDDFVADFSLPSEAALMGDEGVRGEASWRNGASFAAQGSNSGCVDKSDSCAEWAKEGMCEENRSYMVGDEAAGRRYGECPRSCGACDDAVVDEGVDNGAVSRLKEEWPLQWPPKLFEDNKVCVGMTTLSCERGLYTPSLTAITPDDRARASPGIGGPTGCREAWATLLVQDSEVPGALVLIYTLRKYSTEDRDMVVFVSPNVSTFAIQRLQVACVLVMRLAEPYDPTTHIGFAKVSMWLAEEYTRIAYLDPSVWLRKNVEAMWEAKVPASVDAPRHPRIAHEVFNDGAFLFEPSRETFFDMLRRAAEIDSAEQRSDGSVVYLASLFFTAYFLHWSTLPATLLEHQSRLVELLHHEAVESRLHMVIKRMPPFAPYTTLEYGMIQAAGIQNREGVPAWMPGWRIPCAYPCDMRRDQHLWEAVSEEWWHYYYSLIGFPLPTTRATMRLLEPHDPMRLYDKDDHEHCLPFSCDIPDNFTATLTSFEETMQTLQEKHESKVLRGQAAEAKRGRKGKKHGRRLTVLPSGS